MPAQNPPIPTTGTSHISFGETYGYRFAGDTVELNATFRVQGKALEFPQCRLQLRGCQATSTDDAACGEFLIAEAPLPPISELVEASEAFHLHAAATPPAFHGDCRLALVLVSKNTGQPDRILAAVSFPCPERFSAPKMSGQITHAFSEKTVRLSLDGIETTRAPDNLSGTLSLELWALSSVYDGGEFHGVPLAGLILGQLIGQQSLQQQEFELALSQPPAGLWHVTLMLREWTGGGYITRDFRNFDQPLLIKPSATPIQQEKSHTAAQSAPIAPAAEKIAKAPSRGVSINRASLVELASVKGLTVSIATAIIARRPYATLDQLKEVKGVGTKMLSKIRSALTL